MPREIQNLPMTLPQIDQPIFESFVYRELTEHEPINEQTKK